MGTTQPRRTRARGSFAPEKEITQTQSKEMKEHPMGEMGRPKVDLLRGTSGLLARRLHSADSKEGSGVGILAFQQPRTVKNKSPESVRRKACAQLCSTWVSSDGQQRRKRRREGLAEAGSVWPSEVLFLWREGHLEAMGAHRQAMGALRFQDKEW